MPGRLRGKQAGRKWAVLEVLGRCAVEGTGWRLSGVWGWLLFEEVDAAVPFPIPEALPQLATRGLVERIDVRAPWQTRPVWAHRITAEDLALLASSAGRPPPPLAPVRAKSSDAGTFFLPCRLWRAFRKLQARAEQGGGWLTLRQLASAGARLDSADADWLVRCALLERMPDASRRDTWQFRTTAAGLRVQRTAPHSSLFVRVRMCEIPAPTLAPPP